jgi:hypothetical protein
MSFLLWKWRRYPIRRDDQGRSLRQQAFELFDKKLRPSEIYKQNLIPAKLTTLLRYYEDWKRTGGHYSYRIIRKVTKNNPDFKEQLIQGLAKHLEMPVEDVKKRMLRPWGLKQALRGQWPDYGLEREQSEVEARLNGALWFMRTGELFWNSPKELAELLQQIVMLKENVKLEITKKDWHLICKKEEKGIVTTLELDYGYRNKIISEKTT